MKMKNEIYKKWKKWINGAMKKSKTEQMTKWLNEKCINGEKWKHE